MKIVKRITLFVILTISSIDSYSTVYDSFPTKKEHLLAANKSSLAPTSFFTFSETMGSLSYSPPRYRRSLFWRSSSFNRFRRSYFRVVLKNNLLYSALTIPNLGVELGIDPQWTVDVSLSYDPFTRKNDRKQRQFMGMGEIRYWTCEQFDGHFWGFHAFGGMYNIGGGLPYGIKINALSSYRYEGTIFGSGISYGYHFPIGMRWSMEALLGLGYARINYDRYRCVTCGDKLSSDTKNYFGPTRLGINLIYIIR